MSEATVPDKFIEYLEREFFDRKITSRERFAIDETWAMARVPEKRRALTVDEMVRTHLTSADPLTRQVALVWDTTHNTLAKMTGRTPLDLEWARSPRRYMRIDSITRTWGQYRESNITNDLRLGKTSILPTDQINLSTGHDWSGTRTRTKMSVSDLSGDSTAIAQRVRAACKAHTQKLAEDERNATANARASIVRQIAQLQKDLVELDGKIASESEAEQVSVSSARPDAENTKVAHTSESTANSW